MSQSAGTHVPVTVNEEGCKWKEGAWGLAGNAARAVSEKNWLFFVGLAGIYLIFLSTFCSGGRGGFHGRGAAEHTAGCERATGVQNWRSAAPHSLLCACRAAPVEPSGLRNRMSIKKSGRSPRARQRKANSFLKQPVQHFLPAPMLLLSICILLHLLLPGHVFQRFVTNILHARNICAPGLLQ